MDGIALDGARPDDRDFDHEVVEVLRPRFRQRLHLRPTLDLEDAHGVGRLEHREDLGDVFGHAVEIEADGAVVLDQLERLVDGRQHAEAEQVELDELERLDVALVVLGHDAVGHRGPLQRRDVDERRGGDQHAAAMDREVPRVAVHPGTELEPPFPVGEVSGGAGAPFRGWVGLDARDLRRGGLGAAERPRVLLPVVPARARTCRSAARPRRDPGPGTCRSRGRSGGHRWWVEAGARPRSQQIVRCRRDFRAAPRPAGRTAAVQRADPRDADRRVARAALVVRRPAATDRRPRSQLVGEGRGRAVPSKLPDTNRGGTRQPIVTAGGLYRANRAA